MPATPSRTSRKPSKRPAAARVETDGQQRLQKILASAGLGSRRQCEQLISEGRVDVDRQVVTELGAKADLMAQDIRVDGVALSRPRAVYFMLNKPTGVVSTNSDPSGRPRVIDLIPYTGRLFAVGRLDMSSEGLILVTNDGELANRLTHPRYGVEKTYQVEVAGTLDRKELEKLRRGVHLAEGFAKVVGVKVIRQYKQSTLLEIVLNEGRNREIRRLLARVGHKVENLKRVAMGPLRMADLPTGQARMLEPDEVRRLKKDAYSSQAPVPRRRAARPQAKQVVKPAAPTRAVIGGDTPKAARPTRPLRPTAGKKPRPAQPGRGPSKRPTGTKSRNPTRG